jgi:hypothetical protein
MLAGESAMHYVYFQKFLQLPDDERSYARTAKALKLSVGHVTNIASRFKWTLRLAAYQSWVTDCETRAAFKLGEKTRMAEARVAEKAFRFIEAQIDLYLDDRGAEASMTYPALVQAIESLGRFSRVGRGEPSEHRMTEKKDSMENLLERIKDYNKTHSVKPPSDIEVNLQNPPREPHDPKNQSSL